MDVEISEEKVKEYQENGAVLLKNILDQKWLNLIEQGMKENLKNPSKFSERLRDSPQEGAYFNDYFNWRQIEGFKKLILNSPAAEIAGKLMACKNRFGVP